ncbi:MAG TPA: asparagine synthase (glutamine-hydrolyzing) [Terriglobales bacterium]|jgi:asparagine synthase (glutamine-hydrolysing)|nr:asparagine synthase (glutamine-hydrolyzing) [Terriglobales bacterium]
MCGIAGILEFGSEARASAGALREMCRVITHRGPDDEGFYTDGPLGIGMRRLSIVDVAGGHQPISNEDGTLWIVFNGEIYNHLALREQLIARGHRYVTHSDTETVIHLFEEYGADCLQHLRGMFAFAIWNRNTRTLFIARDRLGIKPLYYKLTPERLLFGSEIKAILAHGGIRPEFNRAALPEYLAFGYLSGEESFYSGIAKLLPGHAMTVGPSGEAEIRQYWDLDASTPHASHHENYYVQSYRELLEGAVQSHLMSDVPLGVFLSGGVDSSAVAALMTKLRREPVETFSVGYAEQAQSELPFARTVADHIHSRHQEVLVSEEDFFGALPHLIWHEDEPIVWPSSVSLYFVAKLARERVTVVLTGEGADETLAGYTRYAFTLKNAAIDRAYRSVVPGFLRRGLRNVVATSSLLGATARRKLEHTFLAKDGDSWASFYFDNFFSAFGEAEQRGLLTNAFAREALPSTAYKNVVDYWNLSPGEMLQRLLYTDIKTYLVELLMKQDNMSMAASIESRVPFLDHVLVEFATRIPREEQIQGLAGKCILKKAVEDLLPRSILYRQKMGFPTPWSGWLTGPRLEAIRAMLLEPRSLDRGYFRREGVERLFNDHRMQHRDNADRIWRLLNLEWWHRVCLEGQSHDEIGEPAMRMVSTR